MTIPPRVVRAQTFHRRFAGIYVALMSAAMVLPPLAIHALGGSQTTILVGWGLAAVLATLGPPVIWRKGLRESGRLLRAWHQARELDLVRELALEARRLTAAESIAESHRPRPSQLAAKAQQ